MKKSSVVGSPQSEIQTLANVANIAALTAQPPSAPAVGPDFVDAKELLKRVPICLRTLRSLQYDGKIPYIRCGKKRIIFHWKSVLESLIRQQRGA